MPPWTSVAVRGRRIEGVRRIPEERARGLDLGRHLGAQMLDRLEGRDRAAELHALLRVGDRHRERAIAAAEEIGGERDAAGVEHPLHGVARTAARADPLGRAHVLEDELADAPRAVEGRERLHAQALRVARHERQRARVRRDEEDIRARRVDREERLAGEAIAVFSNARTFSPRPALVRRDREAGVAGRDARQPLLRDRRARRRERDRRHHGRGEERRRRRGESQSLRNDDRVEQREPAAAEILGHEHAGRALRRQRAPERRVVARRRRRDLAHARRRQLLLEEARERVREEPLLLGQSKIHARPLPPSLLAASRGRAPR
jgi:hypothetical protein